MMDIGVYSINGARYMLGEDPIWVTAQETKTDPIKFKEGIDETITFQMGFPSGATASCLSTYSLNYLDKFFLSGTKGFAEMQPSTGYGPIKAKTHSGPLEHTHVTHQTTQMDEMAAIILDGKQPLIPVDGEEGLKDMHIVDAIFKAVKTGQKVSIPKWGIPSKASFLKQEVIELKKVTSLFQQVGGVPLWDGWETYPRLHPE